MWRRFLTACCLAAVGCGSQPAQPTTDRRSVTPQNSSVSPSPIEDRLGRGSSQPGSEFGGPCQTFTNPDATFAISLNNGHRIASTYTGESRLVPPFQMVSSGEYVFIDVQLQQGTAQETSYALGTSAAE